MKKVRVVFDSNQGRWYYGEPGNANVTLPNSKKEAEKQGRELAKRLRDKFQQKTKLEIYKRNQNPMANSPQKTSLYQPKKKTSKSSKMSDSSYLGRKKNEFF